MAKYIQDLVYWKIPHNDLEDVVWGAQCSVWIESHIDVERECCYCSKTKLIYCTLIFQVFFENAGSKLTGL